MSTPKTWLPDRTGVLLVHGLTGSPTEMAPLEKTLRRAGYRTAVPLLAGHGAGHQELLATTWQDWRDGLRRELTELARTCDEVVIVGLCVGGLLGLLLAAEEERVQGLVCLSPDLGFRVPGPAMPWTRVLLPVAYHVPWLRRHGYWTQKPPYGVKNPKLQQRIAKAVAASVQGQTKEFGTFRTYVGTMRELKRLQHAVMKRLPHVRCPTLLIHSVEDSLFSTRNTTVMYRALGSLKKELVLITGCDHVITVDLRKDEVAGRVAGFLAGRHGASVEDEKTDEECYACEISPELQTDPGQCGTHRLIVRKGKVARLVLRLREETGHRTTWIPFKRWSQSPHDGGELRTEWQLARTAIDALAFGLQKRVTIGVDPEMSALAASTRKMPQSTPSPVGL